MSFAPDTEQALITAAALINTSGPEGDSLLNVADLDSFVKLWRYTGSQTHDARELREVKRVRTELRRLWTAADRDELAVGVNTLLRRGNALPQLVRHDDLDWHLHATIPDAPLAVRMGVEAAMALADVVRADEVGRLETCRGEGCTNVMPDLSRNRSRRYCDSGCGNRANVAAHRARVSKALKSGKESS